MWLGGLLGLAAFLLPLSAAMASEPPDTRRIESDDGRVRQTGVWHEHESALAGDNTYLMTDDPSAVLTLYFEGTFIEVNTIAGPENGTLALEVDGVPLRTVNTRRENEAALPIRIDYLSKGPHEIRVYPVEGRIAIDAFVVTAPEAEVTVTGAMPTAPDNPPLLPGDLTTTQRNPQRDASPSPSETSVYMLGDVVVSVFLPNSTYSGAGAENWTSAELSKVQQEVQKGILWWDDLAKRYGIPDGQLDFRINFFTLNNVPYVVNIPYEPILLSQANDHLWINEIMTRAGHDSGSDIGRVRQFNDEQRRNYGADWAFTIFVVDSSADADGKFADGQYFAYSYLNGPYMVMTLDNENWGLDNMELITAHETAHIFGALDEYASICKPSDTHGYLMVANSNCENGNPTEASIMRSADSLVYAYNNRVTSTPNRTAIGWRDSDKDAIVDPLDTIYLPLTPLAPNPTGEDTVQYDNQIAQMVPYRYNGQDSWMTTRGIVYRPTNINRFDSLQYVHDTAAWQDVSLHNPPLDEETEAYHFEVALFPGIQQIAVRSQDRFGYTYYSAVDTVTNTNYDLQAPAAGQYYPNLTFEWAPVRNVSWYRLQILDGGTPIFSKWLAANTLCSDTQCSYGPLGEFSTGDFTWQLETYYDALGYGDLTPAQDFLVGTPALLSPASLSTDGDGRLEFEWEPIPGAAGETHYQIYLETDTGVYVHHEWFTVANCTGSCSAELDVTLPNYNYRWWMQAWGPAGYGKWSDGQNFTLNAPPPAPVQKISPAAGSSVADSQVTFEWQAENNASSYEIYVAGPDGYTHHQTYTAHEDLPCSSTCSLAIELPANGSYTWYLRGSSAGGEGLWHPNQAGGDYGAVSFTLNVPAPGPITKLAPIAYTKLTSNNITFTWQAEALATHYEIYVSGPQGFVYSQTHAVGEQVSCAAGVCSLTVPAYDNGSYTWYLRGKNRQIGGLWSAGQPQDWGAAHFYVSASLPGLVDKHAPGQNAILNSSRVTFSWAAERNATHYEFYLAGPQGYVHHQLYETATTLHCDESTCQVALSLPHNGSYAWYLRGWSAAGYGLWHVNQPVDFGAANFTLQSAAPTSPVLIAPAADDVISTDDVTFSWYAVPDVTYYAVVVADAGSGQAQTVQWLSAEAAGCSDGSGVCQSSIDVSTGPRLWGVMSYGPGSPSVPTYAPGTLAMLRFEKLGF
jgi:hypothetical protein